MDYEECYFKPNSNSNQSQIFIKLDSSLGKVIYNNAEFYEKNVEWLNRNKGLKTKLVLEIEEYKNKINVKRKFVLLPLKQKNSKSPKKPQGLICIQSKSKSLNLDHYLLILKLNQNIIKKHKMF